MPLQFRPDVGGWRCQTQRGDNLFVHPGLNYQPIAGSFPESAKAQFDSTKVLITYFVTFVGLTRL